MADFSKKRSKEKHNKENKKDDENTQIRAFWTGVIAFGLVNLAVSLYPATRSRGTGLKIIDHQGNRLRRRYFCPGDNTILDNDDIVRGFEVEKNTFITVSDAELEALEPKKSREINLNRFVPLEQIEPLYFETGYFLAPDRDAT